MDIEDLAEGKIYDVIIIGAGVIGCSIARELSKYRLNILVLEMSKDVSCGASSANSGIVHGGYDERHGTKKSKLAHCGNQLFSKLQQDLNFGFQITGSLVCAFSHDEIPLLQKLQKNGTENGVEDLKIIEDKEELHLLEPNISFNVVAAMFCPHTGITSPYEYCIALAENAFMNGVEFKMEHKVTKCRNKKFNRKYGWLVGCEHDGNEVFFSGRFVLNCAGLQSAQISKLFTGQQLFQIVPRIGEYLILDRSQGSLVSKVLFPVPHPVRGKGILVSRTYWGNLLLGPTSRDPNEFHDKEKVISEIISNALRLVPKIDIRHTITSYSGYRAKSSTSDFIIDEAEPFFVNVAGIDSPGLTSSPAIAKRVCDIISSRLELVHNHDFYPRRSSIIRFKPVDFSGVIGHYDSAKNIICRCECITEAEIVDAIHRPIGGKTLMGVKKRTRAGMGTCQGSFCEERVRRIISREIGVPFEFVEGKKPGRSLLPHFRVDSEDRINLHRIQRKMESNI